MILDRLLHDHLALLQFGLRCIAKDLNGVQFSILDDRLSEFSFSFVWQLMDIDTHGRVADREMGRRGLVRVDKVRADNGVSGRRIKMILTGFSRGRAAYNLRKWVPSSFYFSLL